MSENGLDDLAYTLLLNEEYPGWLYEVKMGATTIWERWNSVLEDGSISSTGMNSLNHYSYGAIVEWIFAYVGGIRKSKTSVGFNEAIIAPHPDKRLGRLKCEYNSPAGSYKCSWEYTPDGNIQVTAEVPFGCSALLYLPDAGESIFNDSKNEMFNHVKNGACILQPGRYSVTYKPKKQFTEP